MNLQIIPVNRWNQDKILALHVAESQKTFIETPAQCLKEASVVRLWRPVGIYDGNAPIGFAMYGLWKSKRIGNRVWLDRFLINEHHQGKGYGTASLHVLISRLFPEFDCNEIYLSLYADNAPAMRLYERFGFRQNGELDINGELVMVLKKSDYQNLQSKSQIP